MLFSLLCLFFCSLAAAAGDNVPYLGIAHQIETDPPGLRLTRVVPNSPADLAGLQVNDLLEMIDEDSVLTGAYLQAVLATHAPGDRLRVRLQRCGLQQQLFVILGNRSDYTGFMYRDSDLPFPMLRTDVPLQVKPTKYQMLLQNVLTGQKLLTEYEALKTAYTNETSLYQGHFTTNMVLASLLEPLDVVSIGEQLQKRYQDNAQDPAALLQQIWSARDIIVHVPRNHNFCSGSALSCLLKQVSLANRAMQRAFANLSDEELAFMTDTFPELLESYITVFYVHEDPDHDRVESFERLFRLARRVDYQALAEAGLQLAELSRDEFRQRLKRELRSRQHWGIDSTVYLESGDSLIVRFAGMGNDIHRSPAAIIIDPAGHDIYEHGTLYTISNNVNHHFEQGRIQVLIDLEGNDRYICNQPGTSGSGYFSSSLLLDYAGDDIYSGSRLTQGTGVFGSGILLDLQGNDLYLAQEAAQSAAFFGAALLADLGGNDQYHATLYAQGFGGGAGSALLLDTDGDDIYHAAHKHPNGYGNHDTWSGWSQGCAAGFRMRVTGGVGSLMDLAGNDQYEAGNFSQACGYFFGFGHFFDASGNDRVSGNRYCQAALAHQAASWFRDQEGDDRYFGQEATNQAGTWDVGPGFFLDDAGDDVYTGGSISQGGAAQNGIAFFIDADGRDSYSPGSISLGEGGANSYSDGRGAHSLSVFLDTGNDEDFYTGERRKNNTVVHQLPPDSTKKGVGVFIDR